MTDELISIIVPCYNIEDYVDKSVRSILNQTYQNLEVILVDDGSTDHTLDKFNALSKVDSRIKVIHQPNSGVTTARLNGIKHATGSWIGFMDGDDYIEEDMYERLLNNAHTYHAQISHCGYQMVFPSRIDYYYNTGNIVEQDNHKGLVDLLEGKYIEPGLWNKLYHKSLFNDLLDNNLMDTSLHNLEDLLMNYYLFKESNKSIYEDFCPYHYILRKNSATTSGINEHKLNDPTIVFSTILNDTLDSEISNIILSRLLVHLINLSSLNIDKNNIDLLKYKTSSRNKLKEKLLYIINGNFSFTIKTKSILVVLTPWIYKVIYYWYSIIKGTRGKYEVR